MYLTSLDLLIYWESTLVCRLHPIKGNSSEYFDIAEKGKVPILLQDYPAVLLQFDFFVEDISSVGVTE